MQIAGLLHKPLIGAVVAVQGIYDFQRNLLQGAVAHPILQRGIVSVWLAGRPRDIPHGRFSVFVHGNGIALEIFIERVSQGLQILNNIVQRVGACVIGAESYLEHCL